MDVPDAAGREFVAAMQKLKLHEPDPADSPALKAYRIYDYLIAARLQRDLAGVADERLDARVEDFLQAHAGQPVTRALLHAALSGELHGVEYRADEVFGFEVPVAVPGVDARLLDPRSTWLDPAAYDAKALELAGLFHENFTQFAEIVGPEIAAAGPVA